VTQHAEQRLICIGFPRWRRANLAPILNVAPRRAIFVSTARNAEKLAPGPADHLVWWGVTPPENVLALGSVSGAGALRMEDGFIRSVGLGSDLIPPLSVVLDSSGIYFDPRQPSDLEIILCEAVFSDEEQTRARKIREFIVGHGITKYNIETRETARWQTGGKPVILVPGQVEDDASIRFGCSTIRTNIGLLQAVRDGNPDAFIVYKPHPDVMSGNRRGQLALDQAARVADHIETRLSVVSCIEASDELHCMTSLAGFDALLRQRKVVTYGQPFYAGWGLTDDKDGDGTALLRRQRRLTLDELVAGTLIRYPLYWDPDLRSYTSCEWVLDRILRTRDELEHQGRLESLRSGVASHLMRKIRAVARAWLTPAGYR